MRKVPHDIGCAVSDFVDTSERIYIDRVNDDVSVVFVTV